MFSPMQKDVLIEIFNVHIGKAASSLSEMLDQRVILTIPEVNIIQDSRINVLERIRSGFSLGQNLIFSIKFRPIFEGMAYLIYPFQSAKSLSNACMNMNDVSSELTDTSPLGAQDFDVLKEISNVIFNPLIGEFGNLFNLKLDFTVPEMNILSFVDSDNHLNLPSNVTFIILHTNFFLDNNCLAASILIALKEESIVLILKKINELLGELL